MAAAKSTLAKKRNLSLDLVAASKENEERLKVWATLSSNDNNGAPSIPNIPNIDNKRPQAENHDSHHYTRKKGARNETANVAVNNTQAPLQTQSSELRKKWFQKFVSWRYCIILLLQSSLVVGMFLRNCLPMAMVCMVKPRSRGLLNMTGNKGGKDGITFQPTLESISFPPNYTHIENPYYEFDWSPKVQGLVLTSIMFSIFLGPLFVAAVKDRLGVKMLMLLMNISASLLTFLSPEAARISPYCLVVVRLLLGITLGGTVSVVGDCIAWWAPQDERLTMISLSYTGVNIGTIFASLLSGYLCLVPWDNGWPFVFYTFGAISLVWGICWHFLSSLKPEDHPYISEKEKQYIISYRIGMDAQPGKQVTPPYRKVITSVPVLAYFATSSCHIWSSHVLFTYLPAFFNTQMKFAVQETGLLASMTSLFRMLGTFWWTFLGNKTVPTLGVNKSRKLCICVGFLLTGCCTITVGFFDDNYRWVVLALLVFLMVNQSVGSSTIQALPLDLAPRYAGLLSGMNLSLGSLFSISGPLLTSAITANGTLEEWHIVWITMGCMFIAGSIVFLVFGHATLQPWADGKDADDFNIVSPFVIMGRRFSAFMDAPPISPASPREKYFVFWPQLQASPENILSQTATTSPKILLDGNFELGQNKVVKDSAGSPGDMTDSSSDSLVESHTNLGFTGDDNGTLPSKPVLVRAYSESVLEVLRSKETREKNAQDLDTEQTSIPNEKTREENVSEIAKETDQKIANGTEEKIPHENIEDKNATELDVATHVN